MAIKTIHLCDICGAELSDDVRAIYGMNGTQMIEFGDCCKSRPIVDLIAAWRRLHSAETMDIRNAEAAPGPV